MIQTGNKEIDAVMSAITEQRNAAMDSLAVMSGKLKAQEALAAELQKKLDEALKPKEGEE